MDNTIIGKVRMDDRYGSVFSSLNDIGYKQMMSVKQDIQVRGLVEFRVLEYLGSTEEAIKKKEYQTVAEGSKQMEELTHIKHHHCLQLKHIPT